ncbi:peptidyl-tRNA hydrolase [Liquorilactobacillus sucicola DSM 21376 = JCM 15457]|uniref:Peptidyl-tRNA hydrolase n=1 Tax=Liquorilactobacillus sucicola DSM 21376 = JCM 15457 TaxID=1423806 RepID=A0A023D010_9LACO|nr:aminoacyl-tRNA hydrolase [Liquorilactobacillus sucicola]KRN07258.1 peptidyl-tRNA hydrolase [Liquorilactobacillus sucicola DSM 21376 = JCM 15457]GAJ27394.1 peptidyl-tRNA hydrolase [Liquorilactobacillus sucicola DSM 21376 = JCM 15457]
MKLIVGLGNIGKKYEGTKHNVGFMTVDKFAEQNGVSFTKTKCESEIAELFLNGEKILLAKPTTYMNESGRSVGPLLDYFGIDVANFIVIHDDMDLPVGQLRLRQKGSAGGHNGIKSIIAHLGTQNFKRIRIGIDHPQKQNVVDWVLSKFPAQQEKQLEEGLVRATSALDNWLTEGDFMKTMNKYNHK